MTVEMLRQLAKNVVNVTKTGDKIVYGKYKKPGSYLRKNRGFSPFNVCEWVPHESKYGTNIIYFLCNGL